MGLSLAASFVFLPPQPEKAAQASKNIVWDQRPEQLPGGGVSRPFLWFAAPEEIRSQRTVIFFHGNAEDLQLIEADLQQFALAMKCNLLAVEYPGYGLCLQSKGCQEVNFSGVADVAMHALLYCCHVKEIDPSQVVLHGRSLGTAPALHLARVAYEQFRWEIGGIVLQCPFVSIRQVAADYVGLAGSLLVPSDCYNNINALRPLCQLAAGRVFIPILILHGELDKVIKPYHGRTLLLQAIDWGHPSIEGIFPANATHNHWSLREDLVKPMSMFLYKNVEGWREAHWLAGDVSFRCF